MIRKIGVISRTYRHIHRYSEILAVLFKFGFGDLITSLRVERYLDFGRRMFSGEKKDKVEPISRPRAVRMALAELGPTFIKLGQMLSTRPDILPREYIEELVKLQDDVPPFPFAQVRHIIETELRLPLDQVFMSINPEPLAAASIGQVHRARLKDGEEAVVKVQRPGIRETVKVDLEILFHLATLVERHLEGWDVHKPTAVVEEFGRTLEKEMDYGIEAANLEHLAGLFQTDDRVYVPQVHRSVTSPRVLTMEFVEGIKAGAFDELRRAGYDLTQIADVGAEIVIKQTLELGFFHADPHPGNLLILPGQVICLLDLGMVGRLDRDTREHILDLLMAVVRHDAGALVNAVLRLTIWEGDPDLRALRREASEFMDVNLYRPLREIELGRLLQQVFDVALAHRLRVPADLLLLIKALTTIEGVGRQLDPEFDIISKASPMVARLQKDRYRPERLLMDLWSYGSDLAGLFRELPFEFRTLLRLARQGKFKIELTHGGLETWRVTQDRTSNRMAFAIVLASLIVGSSVIVVSGIPPTWHGIPIIGLVGYLVAGVMGFWLLISILRRGMM